MFTATTALPYPHLERATAGLRAALRHQMLGAGVQVPAWDSLEITGPVETTDGRGRLWFEYRATLATISAGF